jgi:hypothetical protein
MTKPNTASSLSFLSLHHQASKIKIFSFSWLIHRHNWNVFSFYRPVFREESSKDRALLLAAHFITPVSEIFTRDRHHHRIIFSSASGNFFFFLLAISTARLTRWCYDNEGKKRKKKTCFLLLSSIYRRTSRSITIAEINTKENWRKNDLHV